MAQKRNVFDVSEMEKQANVTSASRLAFSYSSTSLLYPFSYTCSVVNKKLKFIRGLIEHTESHTIHTYVYIQQCKEHTESRMIHTYIHIHVYVQKILHQLPSVGLAQACPNN